MKVTQFCTPNGAVYVCYPNSHANPAQMYSRLWLSTVAVSGIQEIESYSIWFSLVKFSLMIYLQCLLLPNCWQVLFNPTLLLEIPLRAFIASCALWKPSTLKTPPYKFPRAKMYALLPLEHMITYRWKRVWSPQVLNAQNGFLVLGIFFFFFLGEN